MANQNLPPFFGPQEGIDSKDYLLMMQGETPIDAPISLLGHALTSPSADSSDTLQVTRVKLQDGRIITRVQTKRAAEVRSRSYTIGFPAGALWTPAMQLALSRGCRRTFYMKYLCPSDTRFNHVEIFPDAIMDEPVEEGDLITVDEENVLAQTANITVSEKLRLWAIGFSIVFDAGGTNELHRIRFQTFDCPDCGDAPGLALVTVGGDDTAVPYAVRTADRFTSSSVLTTGGAAGSFGIGLATKGSIIVVGVGAENTVADIGSTTGTLHVSQDNGASFVAIAGVTVPIWGVAFMGDIILAVGGAVAGAATLYVSFDRGASFTAVTSTFLPAADALTDISVDEEAGIAYVVGESGTLLKIEVSGTAVTVSPITNLPGAPGELLAVHVFNLNHLAVGGASNYYAETFDGCATWTEPGVPGTAGITGIAGNQYRALVLTAENNGLSVRDMFTDYIYTRVTLEAGQSFTGVPNDADMCPVDNFNLFAVCTAAGEVAIGKPFYPNA